MHLSVSTRKMNTPLSSDIEQKVLERDDHTCQYCNFKSIKYQQIHYIDQNPDNQSLKNLATTCMFCHQCFNLDKVTSMGSGVLIWLPEVAQTDLNNLTRTIYIARISQGIMAEAAKELLELLMVRREDLKARIGTDDPYVLSTVLSDMIPAKLHQEKQAKLEGVRLFPLDRRKVQEGGLEFNQFPQILAYWRSKQGPFNGEPPLEWLPRYKDLLLKDAA